MCYREVDQPGLFERACGPTMPTSRGEHIVVATARETRTSLRPIIPYTFQCGRAFTASLRTENESLPCLILYLYTENPYIYTYIHIHTYICIYIYIHVYIYIHIYVYRYTYSIYTYIHIYVHIPMYSYMCICALHMCNSFSRLPENC